MKKAVEKVSYEKSIGKLEEILAKLEQGDLSLEKSLKLFQEGMKLSEQCAKLLDEAEQSVKIVRIQQNGESQEAKFSISDEVSPD